MRVTSNFEAGHARMPLEDCSPPNPSFPSNLTFSVVSKCAFLAAVSPSPGREIHPRKKKKKKHFVEPGPGGGGQSFEQPL